MERGADGNYGSYFIASTELLWKYFRQGTNPLEFLPRKLSGSDGSFNPFHGRFQRGFFCFHGSSRERDGMMHGTRRSSRYCRGSFHQESGGTSPKAASIAVWSAPFDVRPPAESNNRCRLFRSLTSSTRCCPCRYLGYNQLKTLPAGIFSNQGQLQYL